MNWFDLREKGASLISLSFKLKKETEEQNKTKQTDTGQSELEAAGGYVMEHVEVRER